MKHNGWRKPTPGLVAAEKYAQAGERLAVPKSQAIVAAKKVAAAIGLKSQDLLLLDTFGAITQPQDWGEGRRPIVWASNHFLMEQTGFSLATLRRHVRRLCEAGVLFMKDSPNGKRWGYRDDEGYIVEAYGFDLAPLAARTDEFEALHAQLQEERALCTSLRAMITVTRRIIRAKIEKALEARLRGPWSELQQEFTQLLQALPKRSESSAKLLDIVDAFNAVKARVEQTFEAVFDWPKDSDAKHSDNGSETSQQEGKNHQNMTPRSLGNETHLQTTNQPSSVNSNGFEKSFDEKSEPEIPIGEGGGISDEMDLDDIQWSSHQNQRVGCDDDTQTGLDVSTLMAAFPEFADIARGLSGGYLRTWDDFHRSAGQVRGICGISQDAWDIAQQRLGPHSASAAIALIYEKYSAQEISSPGGYLRALVSRASDGNLHLERSIYGKLNG